MDQPQVSHSNEEKTIYIYCFPDLKKDENSEENEFFEHFDSNCVVTQKNFEYFSVLRNWLKGLLKREYCPSQTEEYPSNKVHVLNKF